MMYASFINALAIIRSFIVNKNNRSVARLSLKSTQGSSKCNSSASSRLYKKLLRSLNHILCDYVESRFIPKPRPKPLPPARPKRRPKRRPRPNPRPIPKPVSRSSASLPLQGPKPLPVIDPKPIGPVLSLLGIIVTSFF